MARVAVRATVSGLKKASGWGGFAGDFNTRTGCHDWMLPFSNAVAMLGLMSELQNNPQRMAALLAWYREMGVTAVLDETPVDWRARGDVAPGAGFEMPDAPARAAPVGRQFGGTLPAATGSAPAGPRQPPQGNRPAPPIRPPPNVRSFDGSGGGASPGAGAARVKVDATTLDELAAALGAFEGCALKATAKNLCLFRGAEKARVMVIGEAPGRDEDLEGKPFAGPPGALLDKMLAAISLTEGDVHLTNLVYWRPPGNRKPTLQEAAACAPFLTRQIELVAPDIVVVLGDAAARQMFSTGDGIMKVRGKWREIDVAGRKIKAIATLDPAYVLRVPASKRQVWKDLLTIKAVL